MKFCHLFRSVRAICSVVLTVASLSCLFTACSDDPSYENRFTTTDEYASDFLRNREQYSLFTAILERSHKLDLLGTYGSYTVFAPNNDAITKYLNGHGLTDVSQLTQEQCDTITYTHIIEQAFFTTDFNDGTYPKMNMLERPLTITCDSDTVSVPGEVRLAILINRSARMTHADDSVENGVVHTVDAVIGTSSFMLPDVLKEDSTITLFTQALILTRMEDSLRRFIDESYSVGSDSIDWSNDALVTHTGNEYDNVAFMEHRYFKYTAFVPQDKMLADKYDVHDIEGLKALAARMYDPVYPADRDITDPTDRRNSLNRFISYHILPRLGNYYTLTAVDGPNSSLASYCFDRRRVDIADFYETMMPFSILKCSFPSGSQAGLYINRRGVQSHADRRGYFQRGARVLTASEAGRDMTSVNGVYHYIDDVLSYGIDPASGRNIQEYVFSDRLRIDCSSLSPDFMNSGARGHYTRSNVEGGKYGQGDGTQNHNNKSTCLGFKPGAADGFVFDSRTFLWVRPRYLSFACYQADEVGIKGRFNVAVKLPPVPAGDWEVRMLTCTGLSSRGIVQFYLDDVPQGIPYDMRPGKTSMGWRSDSELGDAEQIAAFDKQLHDRGWMKGPASAGFTWSGTAPFADDTSFRNWDTLRKVIGVIHSNGSEYHWLRIEQKMESENNEISFDMIELCPASVYNNPDVMEDKW